MSTDPMDDPANATLGDLIRYSRRQSAKHGGNGGTLRIVLADEETGKPDVLVLIALGNQAGRWTMIADGVIGDQPSVESAVVRQDIDLEGPAVPIARSSIEDKN